MGIGADGGGIAGEGAASAGPATVTVAGAVVTGPVVTRDAVDPRLGAVDVLKPSWRITASKSAFATGFCRYAANRLFCSVGGSEPPYALTAMIGVVWFLLFVVLIYRAAPSPSTATWLARVRKYE